MSRLNLRRLAAPAVALATCMGFALTGLSTTPASAAGTPGVTATTVTIGATWPNTGIASPGYRETNLAANAVFKWINAHGKINGRSINYVLKDDCYGTAGFGCKGNPSTSTDTKALINLPVFATVGSLGTPTQAPERSVLKAAGVPQLFVQSGSIDWNCGVKYPVSSNPYSPYKACAKTTFPGTFGWLPSYASEAMILGQYIKANYAGQKVCFLGQSDDFGHDGSTGLAYEHVTLTDSVYYSVVNLVAFGGSDVKNAIGKFQSTDHCTVVYMDSIPGATALALGTALQNSYSPHWVISSVGSDPVTVENALSGLMPDPEVGAISLSPLPATTDSNPWIAWTRKVLEADPADFPGFGPSTPIDGNMATGVGWGVSFAEALKAAGKNFTRASFLSTMLKTSFQTPALTLLKYSTANHQGLTGGYVSVVSSSTATSKAGGTDGGGKVWVSTGTSGSKVTLTTKLSTSVPSWLH